MKFIGHLDVMRYFQKALRRAEIDVAYTEGFSPHMVLSFASPLGLGLTSNGEYADIELRTPLSSSEAVKRLNSVMVEGIRILSFRRIPDGKSGNAMALVASADYTVRFREGMQPPDGWEEQFNRLYEKNAPIMILKKAKKSEREVDLRPLIYRFHAENGHMFMNLSAGSRDNVKPELVVDAFCRETGVLLDEFALIVNREDLYDEHHRSLEDLGDEIV